MPANVNILSESPVPAECNSTEQMPSISHGSSLNVRLYAGRLMCWRLTCAKEMKSYRYTLAGMNIGNRPEP